MTRPQLRSLARFGDNWKTRYLPAVLLLSLMPVFVIANTVSTKADCTLTGTRSPSLRAHSPGIDFAIPDQGQHWRVGHVANDDAGCVFGNSPQHWTDALKPYLPDVAYTRLIDTFPVPQLASWSTLTVRSVASSDASSEKWEQRTKSAWEQQSAVDRSIAVKGEIAFEPVTADGMPGVKATRTYDVPTQHMYISTVEYVFFINSTERSVIWNNYATSEVERSNQLSRSQSELATMAASMKFE